MGTELDRNYECPRCGIRAIVVVEAEASMSPWRRFESRAISPDGMARQDDATRSLGLVRCPSCNQRPPLALVWSALRVLGYAIGAVLVYSILGSATVARVWRLRLPFEYIPVVFGAAGVIATMIEIRRWGAAGKARIVRVIAAPVERALPVAKARRVRAPSPSPAVAPRPAAAPVKDALAKPAAPAAPPSSPPPAPGDGPRFLKS
jgi:hypothetical protein